MNDPGALFFILMAGLAGTMTLIYFPLRIFLTATARSRRLKLLQRIRRLRDELGQPIQNWFLLNAWTTTLGREKPISLSEGVTQAMCLLFPSELKKYFLLAVPELKDQTCYWFWKLKELNVGVNKKSEYLYKGKKEL